MAWKNKDNLMDNYFSDEIFEDPYTEDENITRWELKEILGLPSNGEVKKNQYLDVSNKGLWPKAAQEIADHLKFDIEWITIDLSAVSEGRYFPITCFW